MISKKYPEMPKGNWKASLAFSPKTEGKKASPEKPQKIPKPIPKISDKKKARIKENGSESDLFAKVWEKREHRCEICRKPIREPRPECFSHRLSKGRYPALRYNEKNIALVCSMECHAENDSRNAGNDVELIKEILGE